MSGFVRRVTNNMFIRNNTIFFFGSMIAAALSYLYHPLLGRLMSLADFGEAQTMISLSFQVGIILSVFSTVVIHLVANHTLGHEELAVLSFFRRLSLVTSLGFFGLLLVFGGRLQHSFHFQSRWPFLILALMVVVSVFTTFRLAYLQGKRQFFTLSLAGIIGAAGKLGFAICLVLLGTRTIGAIAGLLLAQGAVLGYTYYKTRRQVLFPSGHQSVSFLVLRPYLLFAGAMLVLSMTVTFFYSGDVLLVKLFLSPEEAGAYSGIATIGRIIFFLTGSIAAVLFSTVTCQNSRTKNYQLLFQAIGLTLLLGGGTLIIFMIAPSEVIRLLLGARFVPMASLLPLVGGLNLLVSLLNVLIMYELALRQYSLLFNALWGIGLVVVLTTIWHQSAEQLVLFLFCGAGVMLVTALFRNLYHYLKYRYAYDAA